MTTTISANGSGHAQPIETLFARLKSDTLDPRFEAYGNFVEQAINETHFFGNFETYSHVFSIWTDDADLIDRLTTAIRANQATGTYKKLRDEQIGRDKAERLLRQQAYDKQRAEYLERMKRYG